MELSIAESSSLLATLGEFSDENIQQFKSETRLRCFRNGQYLLEAGEVCLAIYLVVSGNAYQFATLDEHELIQAFYGKGDWCLCSFSFIRSEPSLTSIRALGNLVVLELTAQSVQRLIKYSPAFCQLGRLLDNSPTY